MADHRLVRFRAALIAIVGMAVGVVATVTHVTTRAGADADRCADFRQAARARAGVVSGAGEEILVIGDSYAAGLAVPLRDSWPGRLPGTVRVDAFSGSGFSRSASPCGDLSYAARAPHSIRPETSLVVVQGGLNDVDQSRSAIVEGFESLMGVVGRRPVLVVGPPMAPARADLVRQVDALLAALAALRGASYLSLVGLELAYLDDGLHLTAAGHHQFGNAVAAQVVQLAPVD